MRGRIFDTLLNVTAGDQLQFPAMQLDRFLLLCSTKETGISWLEDNFEVLHAKLSIPHFIVRPIWDERDPFEIKLATRSADVIGHIYYEIIDIINMRGLTQASRTRMDELRRVAQASKRIRHDKTTHTWPEPAHNEQWTPAMLGQTTPQPTIPDIVKEPRWPF